MLLPEIILYNSINSLLQMLTDDWTANVDKTQTMLSDLFSVDDNGNALVIDTYNYYSQAQAILLCSTNSPRKLQTYIGYNLQRLQVPTIHILMPSESKGSIDTLGDLPDDPNTTINANNQEVTTKAKSSSTVYNLMITSDNSSEVLIVYYFLKGIMTMYDSHFELSGLKNFTFAGSDIQFQQDLAPNNIYHRSLSVSFQYKSNVFVRRSLNTATGGLGFGLCATEVVDFYPPGMSPQNLAVGSIGAPNT